jgi:hypothetical protein
MFLPNVLLELSLKERERLNLQGSRVAVWISSIINAPFETTSDWSYGNSFPRFWTTPFRRLYPSLRYELWISSCGFPAKRWRHKLAKENTFNALGAQVLTCIYIQTKSICIGNTFREVILQILKILGLNMRLALDQ